MPSSAMPPEATQHSRPQTQPRVLALTWDAKRSRGRSAHWLDDPRGLGADGYDGRSADALSPMMRVANR